MSYTEVFKPEPEPERRASAERLYYTITDADVGTSRIKTTAGVIPVADVMGRIQRIDVGKRLYRVPVNAGDSHIWQVENSEQRDRRLAKR
jgi:hypothetical protein